MYIICNRYQDSWWEATGRVYPDFPTADTKAAAMATNPIIWGMVCVCAADGTILSMYGAGSGPIDDPCKYVPGGILRIPRGVM